MECAGICAFLVFYSLLKAMQSDMRYGHRLGGGVEWFDFDLGGKNS